MSDTPDAITRKTLMVLLNGDLSREFMAVIACVVYSQTPRQALALRVLAERLEHAEVPGELLDVSFRAARGRGLTTIVTSLPRRTRNRTSPFARPGRRGVEMILHGGCGRSVLQLRPT